MIGYGPMEVLVTPDMTYILMERDHDHYRRMGKLIAEDT